MGSSLGALIPPVVFTIFGLFMLGSRLTLSGFVLQGIGIVALIAGVLLLGYALLLYRKAKAPAAGPQA
jgi:membrane protein implicated in regulation of membrane protease activity